MRVSFLGSNLATPVPARDSAKLFLWAVLEGRVFKNELPTADDLLRNMIKNLLQFLLPCRLQYSRTRESVMPDYNYVPRGKTTIAKMLLNPVFLHLKYTTDFVLVMCKEFGSCSKSHILYCSVLDGRIQDPHLSSSFQYYESLFKLSSHTEAFLTCWYIWLL